MGSYFGEKIQGNKPLEDLCNQIVMNSQIASTKYNMFKVTTLLMIVGQILLFFSFWIRVCSSSNEICFITFLSAFMLFIKYYLNSYVPYYNNKDSKSINKIK